LWSAPVLSEQEALRIAVGQRGTTRDTRYPGGILDAQHADLWIALQVPDAARIGLRPDDGGEQLWLLAPGGSWSMVDLATNTVEQHGPRHLWDEVELAYQLWDEAGRPAATRSA
jgi:protein-L-isoaspartate(D-aspartate) O-methyltransferase